MFGPIAQLAEPPAHNRKVPGSNPGGPTDENPFHIDKRKNRLKLQAEKSNIFLYKYCWAHGAPFLFFQLLNEVHHDRSNEKLMETSKD